MRTNPNLPDRKRLRLKGYDYSREGAYFITICCQDRKHRFGKVVNGIMQLNEIGRIAHDEWVELKVRYPHLNFDIFQIMPNHMHGIVVIGGPTLAVGREIMHPEDDEFDDWDYSDFDHPRDDHDHPWDDGTTARVVSAEQEDKNASLSDAMGAYKSIVSVKCLELFKSRDERMGKLWQRSFDDKIIRSENSFQNIANYIVNNPKNWGEKKF